MNIKLTCNFIFFDLIAISAIINEVNDKAFKMAFNSGKNASFFGLISFKSGAIMVRIINKMMIKEIAKMFFLEDFLVILCGFYAKLNTINQASVTLVSKSFIQSSINFIAISNKSYKIKIIL
jgi:hypothetical protein